eukprot:EG_transcript_65450
MSKQNHGLHNRLIPIFVKENAFNGFPLVNKGKWGSWLWFRNTQLKNLYHPLGAVLKWPRSFLMLNGTETAFWMVFFWAAANTWLYSRQRKEFIKDCDYG